MSTSFHCDLGWCLFLHMPRTGGTWLESVIQQAGFPRSFIFPRGASRHGLPDHYKLDGYDHVFTVVRHPFTWYASTWRFLKGHEWKQWEPGRWHPWRPLEPFANDDFNEWVADVCLHEPAYFTRYVEQVIGPPGKPRLHRIMMYEKLEAETYCLLQDAGLTDHRAGQLSKSPTVNFPCPNVPEPIWEKEVRNAVLAVESPLIRRFYPRYHTIQ